MDGERIFCNPMWVLKRCRGGRPCGGVAESATSEELFGYDTIFAGFPIWWYVAPTIINTFLESYDLTGKIIIPFATSGGSGMGKTNERLAPSCKGAKLLGGKVFKHNVGHKELAAWVDGLEL